MAVRVLVVDDVVAFLGAMISVVGETSDFDVVGQASSGEEAVAVAAAVVPDLVLMDVHLPGIDGLEATRRLLAAPRPPTVVLLSTCDADAGEELIAACGAAAYLPKGDLGTQHLQAAWFRSRR